MLELQVLDGYIQGEQFILRGIQGQAVYGKYKADGLRSLARLIHHDEPFSFTIDKERTIHVPLEVNKRLIQEFNMIADELEG